MGRAIKAKLLIDGTGRKPLPDPLIFVEGGRIARISSLAEAGDALGAGSEIIDCSGQTIIPGLIDAHVHLTFSGAKDAAETRRVLAQEDDERLAIRALSNAQRALRSGVTTLRDCGGRGLVTLKVRDAIDSGLVVGPRILTCGMPVTTTAGHLHWCGLRADGLAEVRQVTRQLVESGVDFIKVMGTGGHMTPISNYRMPQYTLEEMRAIVEEAHRLCRHVAVHVHATEGIRRAVEAGVDMLEHCSWVRAEEGDDYDPGLTERIVERGVYVDLQRKAPLKALQDGAMLAEERPRHAPWRDMAKRGAKLILGTDAGCSSRVPFDLFPLVVASAVKLLDMNPMEALMACTRLPAEAFGMEGEIGTLEPGKRADMVILDGNPLEDILHVTRVERVFLGGEEVRGEGLPW